MPNFDENEVWDFADEQGQMAEIHLSGTDQKEEEGFVIKEVVRTGEWNVIPTKGGIVNKPLKIVRDGTSSHEDGIISLSEIEENFKAGAVPAVQIPLSDDNEDHKNITKLNTGFVRDLWIKDEDGVSKLVAKMEFTEPDVKEKVLRGTYADVSCGIPWNFTSRGNKYNAALEHVCITNRPFIDGLGPFLAASDQVQAESAQITHFGDAEGTADATSKSIAESAITAGQLAADAITTADILANEFVMNKHQQAAVEMSDTDKRDAIQSKLVSDLNLSSDYVVAEVGENSATVNHLLFSDKTWTVPFEINGSDISLADVKEWKTVDDEGEKEPVEITDSPHSEVHMDPLEAAQRLREIRLSGQSMNTNKEEVMPLTREELAQLELSDDARAKLGEVLDEAATLRAQVREKDADRRIEELKELGLSERPGALKLYRDVMLSDDGGPAVVLLSDSGEVKEQKTALELLDEFIVAIKGSDEKLNLSDQALVSENDNKPPVTAEDEIPKTLEERLEEARKAIKGV